jgi:hypothetical protein
MYMNHYYYYYYYYLHTPTWAKPEPLVPNCFILEPLGQPFYTLLSQLFSPAFGITKHHTHPVVCHSQIYPEFIAKHCLAFL